MLELPEAAVIAAQINQAMRGKRITQVTANQNPHAFAWYTGDPAAYPARLIGKTLGEAVPCAGLVEIQAEDQTLVISTAMRYFAAGIKLPKRHQLLLNFEDGSAFCCTVQMWGCMLSLGPGETSGLVDLQAAKACTSLLSEGFTRAYFDGLFDEGCGKLSAKEFLATKQRIPGLGNGILQDILWTARIHPRRKMSNLSGEEIDAMYRAVVEIPRQMAECGGRDTERDLYGNPGRYVTVLSKNTAGQPCPACGMLIKKEAFMGGSIYYCSGCQQLG